MPVWLLLAVVGGLFTGVVLAMVIGFHLLETNSAKQCVHRKQQQSEKVSTGGSEPGQLCCLCGNVRKRVKADKSNDTTDGTKMVGILQPLVDAACRKLSEKSSKLWIFGSRISHWNSFVRGRQGGWFSTGILFRGMRKGVQSNVKGSDTQAPTGPLASAGCAESAAVGSIASAFATSLNGSSPGSMTTITTTITTTTSTSSISTPTACGVATGGSEEGTKQLPQRRLVLEILMSPSGDGMGGALPRATGVRLKLETNASLDSLASVAAAASSGGEDSTQLGPPDIVTGAAFTADLTSTICGELPTTGTSAIISNSVTGSTAGTRQGSNQKWDSTSVGTLQVVDAAVNSNKSCARVNPTAGSSEELDYFQLHAVAGSMVSGCSNSQKGTGYQSPSSISVSSNSNKSKPNGSASTASKSKLKGGTSPLQCASPSISLNGLCALSTASASSLNLAGQALVNRVAVGHHGSMSSSSDGLGSLRISLLEAVVKGKSVKDCTKGVTADIASALAALNVDSIGGKGVGMGSAIVSGVMLTESGKVGNMEGTCNKAAFDLLLEEEVTGEGSGSEQGIEEGDEHQPVGLKGTQAGDEDDADGKRKEKKKKKNRGRRHKAKLAKEDRKDFEKVALTHGELHTGVSSSEVEVGCICGTSKGGFHSSNCPYPFTCSGSMVQRKIKEQYDELVRSNAAKTLTLAQVGRFTTCLVEAKSALQQKSDTIQRRFTIAKSLLAKADKSSFDRLCGQIYGLEIEQKKLEEDTVVYNRLQEQLKLSPAYLKMLEYGRTHFELQPNTGQLIEKLDAEDEEISFEELLAQEKKDSFWQKHGPARSSVSVS